jgi:hypothetical protein
MRSFNIPFVMFVGFVTTVTGCQSDSVRLRHPQTGQIAQCGPYGSYSSQTAAKERERCIVDYQEQGYQRVMQ